MISPFQSLQKNNFVKEKKKLNYEEERELKEKEREGGVGGESSMPTLLKHKYQLKIVHYIRQINVLNL